MDIRAGYKSTEFWLTLFSSIFGILVATNHLTPDQATQFTSEINALIGAVLGIVPLVSYVWSRTKLKQNNKAIESATAIENIKADANTNVTQ